MAHVIGEYLRRHRPPGRKPVVAIGYDTRFLGNRFAEVSAEALAGPIVQTIFVRRIRRPRYA